MTFFQMLSILSNLSKSAWDSWYNNIGHFWKFCPNRCYFVQFVQIFTTKQKRMCHLTNCLWSLLIDHNCILVLQLNLRYDSNDNFQEVVHRLLTNLLHKIYANVYILWSFHYNFWNSFCFNPSDFVVKMSNHHYWLLSFGVTIHRLNFPCSPR